MAEHRDERLLKRQSHAGNTRRTSQDVTLRRQIPPASSFSLSFLHSVDQQVFREHPRFSPLWWDGLNGIAQRKAPVPSHPSLLRFFLMEFSFLNRGNGKGRLGRRGHPCSGLHPGEPQIAPCVALPCPPFPQVPGAGPQPPTLPPRKEPPTVLTGK